MPECMAHTHVQWALHSLILEDNTSAVGYLRRALSCLEEVENERGGSVRKGVLSLNRIQRQRSSFSDNEFIMSW
jgi:hypothetical protein